MVILKEDYLIGDENLKYHIYSGDKIVQRTNDPMTAIKRYFSEQKRNKFNVSINTHKRNDALNLIKVAYKEDNLEKIKEWCENSKSYKWDYIFSSLKKYNENENLFSFYESKYDDSFITDQIEPFSLG